MESNDLSQSRFASLRTSVVLAIVFAIGTVAGMLIDGGSTSRASSSLTDSPAFEVFEETWNLVQDRYVLPDELDDTELMYGAARGMVEAVGDVGHSAFLDPVDAQSFRASLSGELIGIGVRLEFTGRFPEVVEPIRDSPAEIAGIESGDLIVAIDGRDTGRLTSLEVGSLLRGEEGVPVDLTVERPDTAEQFELTIVRARIEIDPVEWAELPQGQFLIRLSEFSEGAGEGVADAVDAALQAGATGIILDLRGNPGGSVYEAEAVAAQFMPPGTVLYIEQQRDAEPENYEISRDAGRAQNIPLVVLVDENSASAAEIVAASLRDNGRAEVVGVPTFGTGTIVSSFDLDDGSIAAIGTAVWTSPAGESARNVGIQPSVIVEMPPDGEQVAFDDGDRLTSFNLESSGDLQLRAALELLSGAMTHHHETIG
ncbi:MAG: S41 family peptidase [Thermomicrobiales bacterium]